MGIAAVAGDGLSPRGISVANRLWAAAAAPATTPVQVDFERRLGPLALACQHWRRRLARRCVQQWRRAAAAGG
eukprot:COSAG06_NODE_4741_length_3989_cov_2.916967_1_plen_72_part_10